MSAGDNPPISESISAFLRQQGLPTNSPLIPMTGGANNRVYKIVRAGGEVVLKCYFQNPNDPRDRFGAEQAFYQWVWSKNIRRTPEPLAWSPEERLGLFAFVPGRKLQPEEVSLDRVQEALDFLSEINAGRDSAARAMPPASEACFSLPEHLACVDRRIARLEKISPQDAIHDQALTFVRTELGPAWTRIREAIVRKAASNSAMDQPLAQAQRCLSPSDFGFHNAILAADQRLRFLDFEYAGWDDPAKLACDFFCQPTLAVNHLHWDMFLSSLAGQFKADPGLPGRARLLLPAYQIKWCCIMLNEFVRSEEARRQFAAGAELTAERKASQLSNARHALANAVELPGEMG